MNTSLHDRAWVLKTYMVAQDVIYFQDDPGQKSEERGLDEEQEGVGMEVVVMVVGGLNP